MLSVPASKTASARFLPKRKNCCASFPCDAWLPASAWRKSFYGIVVNCQTQRSQFQNRDYAMEMLKAKLYQIAKQQHKDKIDDIKGVQNEIAWGHQIRSYVFMPYTMVKDHRTNYETGNVDAVMDGDLDGFIFAYLKAASRGELQDT